jgi:hypothetical protein
MTPEEKTDTLFKAVYENGILNVYDFCAAEWKDDESSFMQCKALADGLAEEKLARYNDVQRTELCITNFGRYWAAHGGYHVYLQESEKKIKPERDKHNEELKEELKEARLKFTHYRIVTYWWSFAFSIIGFLLSLLSLYLVLRKK